ncbi:hypothetical protein [Flavobacterium limi]|uniref:Uncharacterized protein n=1 Tax=Flavobacterium limi TaxID=2045105 RepID=A0ABQ1TSI9_9FLAO|nr:hypothetical protein [Flavobacterium limi]GGF01485.1 hypothetical protein GCM10011518_08630 [Flavobacterium limi]
MAYLTKSPRRFYAKLAIKRVSADFFNPKNSTRSLNKEKDFFKYQGTPCFNLIKTKSPASPDSSDILFPASLAGKRFSEWQERLVI